MFGIYVQDSYRSMVKRNWDFRFANFLNCVKSWSGKFLPSLKAKIEILKMYALSRIYYLASILPINKTMIKKFESALGNFLWNGSGWLLRVAYEDIKNSREKGGLGMVCVSSMFNSLLLSQFLRLLKSADTKYVSHILYWLGDTLQDILPGTDNGLHPRNIPEYFSYLEYLVVLGRIDDVIGTNWKSVTNKMIYMKKTESFATPKAELKAGVSFNNVWCRINSPVLESSSSELLYLLVHNKLPVQERLFRVGLSNDPYCETCPDAINNDVKHFFCLCSRVSHVWTLVRDKLHFLTGNNATSDHDLMHLLFSSCSLEKEAVWLIGNYVWKIWDEIYVKREACITLDEFFGYLTFKYKADQTGARYQLAIPWFT